MFYLLPLAAAGVAAGIAAQGETEKILGVSNPTLENLLTEEDKISFVKGLIRLAKADKKVVPEEGQYLDEIIINFGLDVKYIPELRNLLNSDIDISNISVSFSERKKSIIFLREAIQLCKVDGLYHQKEREEINKIAKDMGVSHKIVKEIEHWIDRGIEWQKEGEQLITMEE